MDNLERGDMQRDSFLYIKNIADLRIFSTKNTNIMDKS